MGKNTGNYKQSGLIFTVGKSCFTMHNTDTIIQADTFPNNEAYLPALD